VKLLVIADNSDNWLSDEWMRSVAQGCDAVLTLGDMYRHDLEKVTVTETPMLGVYGNHCRRNYIAELGGVECAGGVDTIALVKQTVLGTTLGVNGCVRYSTAKDFQHTQEEYENALRVMPSADIVVTHAPPKGINDHEDEAHNGIDALKEWVDTYRPAHLFHGHTYPENPVTRYRGTEIHYVHGYAVIDI
jgi:Icc-related predicted phosphoesterase